MTAVLIIPLQPGRYRVRGGPRGETATERVARDLGDGRALLDGRRVARNTSCDRWPVLAAFRVRPGTRVTHYGALDAVGRVWSYGENDRRA